MVLVLRAALVRSWTMRKEVLQSVFVSTIPIFFVFKSVLSLSSQLILFETRGTPREELLLYLGLFSRVSQHIEWCTSNDQILD